MVRIWSRKRTCRLNRDCAKGWKKGLSCLSHLTTFCCPLAYRVRNSMPYHGRLACTLCGLHKPKLSFTLSRYNVNDNLQKGLNNGSNSRCIKFRILVGFYSVYCVACRKIKRTNNDRRNIKGGGIRKQEP